MARVVKLTITHDLDTNQIRLDGPLDNEMYCYGLLKKAEVAVTERAAANLKKGGSSIVVPSLLTPDGF